MAALTVGRAKKGVAPVYFLDGMLPIGDLLLRYGRYVFQPQQLCPLSTDMVLLVGILLERINEGLETPA